MLLCGAGGAIVGSSLFLYRVIEARDLLIEYLNCESTGTAMECDRSEFEDTFYPTLGINDLSLIATALAPLFFLIYIVPFQDTKKRMKACCSKTK